jgi:cysteinyl-tRNA synthetase
LGDVKIYDKILGIISCNFSTGDAIKELIKYIDKFMKVYLTDEKAQEIKAELDLANGLLNIIDWDLLEIDDQTRNFISLREELRVQKQFVQTDLMREELKKNFIFEDENTGFSLIKKLN